MKKSLSDTNTECLWLATAGHNLIEWIEEPMWVTTMMQEDECKTRLQSTCLR